MTYEWKNKVVIITGAATSIGAEVVRIILKENIKHVAILDVAENAGVALQNELNAKYGDNKVKFYKCDVTNEGQLIGCFKHVTDAYGCLDVLVNNAGILNDNLETYRKEIEVNVIGPVSGTLRAMELMGKDKGGAGGTIINIASVVALHQSPLFPVYTATKSAVLQFSNCIGLDEHFSKTGIRILTVCFGATDTPLLSLDNMGSFDKDMETKFATAISEKYIMQRKELAAQGVVDAYKLGESGTTWVVTANKPAKDVTENIRKAYSIMSEHIFA